MIFNHSNRLHDIARTIEALPEDSLISALYDRHYKLFVPHIQVSSEHWEEIAGGDAFTRSRHSAECDQLKLIRNGCEVFCLVGAEGVAE